MGAAGKHKKRCTGKPYTAQEAKLSAHKRKRICSNNPAPALAGEAKISYNTPCGAAEWPLCRWVLTRAGLWVRYHPQAAAFLFSRGIIARKLGDGKYLRKLSGGSRGLPPLPFYPGGGPCQGWVFVAFPRKSWYNTFVCAARYGLGGARAPRQRM